MNYEEMSDFEINKAVAEIEALGLDAGGEFDRMCAKAIRAKPPSYCNNWADAGPIIEANKITLRPLSDTDGRWEAEDGNVIYDLDENPRRAAMVVSLKMQEAK